MSAERDFLDALTELEVPVFHAPAGGSEFERPGGWQSLTSRTNQGAWTRLQESGGAVMACTGTVAVVDVDTKNGAAPEAVRQLLDGIGCRVYADVLTPSGGRHFYVAGHPDLPSVSATAERVGLTGYPGVEVLSHGRNVFLPGTRRPKYEGGGYLILSDDLAVLADGGDEDSAEALVGWVAEHRASSGSTFTPSPPWDGTPPDRRQQAYLDAALARMREEVGATIHGGRNDALHHAALAVGNYVAGAGMDETTAIEVLLDAAKANGLVDEDGQRACLATIHSGIRYGRTRPRAVPEANDRSRPAATSSSTSSGEPLAMLAELLTDLRGWHHLPDPTHVAVALAAAATRDAEGEPCWVLMVAPPSSGKTEAVRLLDRAADDRLDEVTAAGMLGWSKGKQATPTGVLARAGARALVTFGDLSTLLATSDRGGRDVVFGLLRRAYDGHVTRDVSPPGRTEGVGKLEWSGRLTVVACVTGAIDRAAAHNDQLGPRWLYVRLPERDTAAKREASRLARAGGLAERRAHAADLATTLVETAARDVDLDVAETVAEVIEDAALVTAWGRASVPRNGYGRREIEGVPVIEEPMRLVQQLGAVARGLSALGLPVAAVEAITRRVALDSMPEARRSVLAALATGEVLTTAGVARAASVDRKVARMQLEELAAIGVAEHDRADEDDDELTGAVHWSLSGEDGALIADVFSKHRRGGGWDETWVSPTPPPRIRGEEAPPTKSHPTLRPTPAEPSCPTCGGPIESARAALGYQCLACREAS